ncbi:MAG: hypothetical protein K2M56_00485 [Muribaculaceae bacterium]|nr:hypothetical protein [Muribaculaceae bacterium]
MAVMRPQKLSTILTAIAAILFCIPTRAQAPYGENVTEEETITVTKVMADSTVITAVFSDRLQADEFARSGSLVPQRVATEKEPPKKMSPLMLGLEFGTGLDLSSTDMSTFNADFIVGYRHKVIQLLGIQAGIHKSLGTRDSFIPIYAVFRTGFLPRPTLAFMHISVGYSFSTISNSPMFGDTSATIGAGINLVSRPKFQSNIILAVGYRHFSDRHQELAKVTKPNISFAQISFGISM